MMLFNNQRPVDNVFGSHQLYRLVNTSLIDYGYKREFVYRFDESVCRRSGFDVDTHNVDRSRKFYIEDGVIRSLNDDVPISNFLRSRFESRRRSLDMFYRTVMKNSWSYFVTLTIDPNAVVRMMNSTFTIDRYNDSMVVYAWKLFRQRLQFHFPDIKIFCVPERHSDGALHFHALLSNCDLSDFLVPAEYNGNNLFTSFGDQIFNFSDIWGIGFTTVVNIGSDLDDHEKVCNYLTKYISKSSSVSFNCKSFYTTHNVDRASKISCYMTFDEILRILDGNSEFVGSDYDVIIKKNNSEHMIFDVRICSQSYRCSNDSVNIT